ncbi:unnamed protein product [Coregonus sp. 'balchen']|nr:unnamed protein product [Coregonus sp. 'balchen']
MEPSSTLVPFLHKYCDVCNKKPSVMLKLELKKIREQQDMLFCFMNFLTQEGAVHVLQFCLTMGPHAGVVKLQTMRCLFLFEAFEHFLFLLDNVFTPMFCHSDEKLLQHPELSNSQLLADFPSPRGLASQFVDKMLPDSFVNRPSPKPSQPELTILSPTSENDKKVVTDTHHTWI